MSSRSRSAAVAAAAAVAFAALFPPAALAADAPVRELRICADPNNLPFSNRRLEGFENKIAEILARDLGARITYTWWAQRRGFFRNTLKAGLCDVVLGVPTGMERAVPTRPYYRSTYVFVSRADRALDVRSFDDPALRNLRIGVQLAGDDYANTPPAHALTRRRIVGNVVGFTLYGDYGKENPPARIVEAVARKEIDIAVVWGPLAGYFARRQRVALRIVPVSPAIDRPFLPFVYDIAVGVRRGDDALRNAIDVELERRRSEIDAILDAYGVPRVSVGEQGAAR
jgi:mxaJ protein